MKLPRWFAALDDAKTLCCQLTPIGGPAPELHVSQPFDGSQFVIAGGAARQQVCWQVTGTRIDAFAKANPVVVEAKKNDSRPSGPNPSAKRIEKAGKALRDTAARREKGAKNVEKTIAGLKFPAFPKPERPAEPEGGLKALSALAKNALACSSGWSARRLSPC